MEIIQACAKLTHMRVAGLFTYPVKSCYRVQTLSIAVEPWGLVGDRRWLVVDAQSRQQLTQRKVARLGRIRPVHQGDGLLMTARGFPDLFLPAPRDVPLVEVGVWDDKVEASPADATAAAWVSKVIGRDAQLVYLDDPTRRPLPPGYGAAGASVSFADGFPLLLTNSSSLVAVNDWLLEDGDEPIEMTRFRPNLVVAGATAWAEDEWLGRCIGVGEAVFRVVKPCARCVLTTVDQETGEKGREPLHVLGRHRRFAQGLLFGTNLVPETLGTVNEGDEVRLL
jgi:uncharacterized protein YcbX